MIRLFGKYVILVDPYNYTLAEETDRVDKKTGKQVYKTLGHCNSLENCLTFALDTIPRAELENGEKSLSEALSTIRKAKQEILSAYWKIEEGDYAEASGPDLDSEE